jgi:hypothetical protein
VVAKLTDSNKMQYLALHSFGASIALVMFASQLDVTNKDPAVSGNRRVRQIPTLRIRRRVVPEMPNTRRAPLHLQERGKRFSAIRAFGCVFSNASANSTRRENSMQAFTRLLPRLSFLMMCFLLLGGLCVAQEVDVPTGRGNGSVVAPSGWVELIAPVQPRIDLKLYGFYIGEMKAPSGQFDATFRPTKFLSITPSYLYYSVPASGLNELANRSLGFTHTYDEHQFRIDGTVALSIHKFEISERNMYVRRFLETYQYAGKLLPAKEINRYRNRIGVAYPLAVKGHIWKPFASYEAFYDQGSGWTKNRVWTGVTVPIEKHVSFQPSYMWESTNGIKDLHYLMFGLIFKTPSWR